MAAFNYTQPVDATGEQITSDSFKPRADFYPNFNGQASTPYNGNFVITGANDLPAGLLWTAHYAVAGPNTITIQFSSPLVSVSTTTSDYTLSGTGAPSITSVVWNSGSRSILLNLSGSLSAVNTYTLAIASSKVLSGHDISYVQPKIGVYNWPGLVVDVIQPATISCTGVGVQQDITLGDPSMQTENLAQSIGFVVDVDEGDPLVNSVATTTGVGVQVDVNFGTPTADPDAVPVGVGIVVNVEEGTPVVIKQEMPVGVGIQQDISLGTPNNTISPLTPTAVGIAQIISVGSPVVAGPANCINAGFEQIISEGTPTVAKLNTQEVIGVGINVAVDVGQSPKSDLYPISVSITGIQQNISHGTPSASNPAPLIGVGVAVNVEEGIPVADISPLTPTGVGINQVIDEGTPEISGEADLIGVGVDQVISLGSPDMDTGANFGGIGIQQDINFGSATVTNIAPNLIGVGIQQDISLGTPVSSPEANLVSAGIQQDISFGSPTVATIAPNFIGVGVQQNISLGTATVSKTGDTHAIGAGITQDISLGAPFIDQVSGNIGVGIQQNITLGTPTAGFTSEVEATGFDQDITVGTPVSLHPLRVTARQKSALLDLDTALHKAFGDGVEGDFYPDLINKIDGYLDDFTTLQQVQTRTIFEDLAAATMVALNIPAAYPNTDNDMAVEIAKVAPIGTNGLLTFVDGVLTAKTEPTGKLDCVGIGIEQSISAGVPDIVD